jgi:hypothetical protein
MNRCTPRLSSPSRACLLVALTIAFCAGVVSLSAHAQTTAAKPSVREFPKAALRGEMVVKNHPEIVLNGKAERLSPGARIWDKDGALVMSARLAGQVVTVNYLREGGGLIHQVWILNSEELKEKRAGGNATIFNFITGSTPATP